MAYSDNVSMKILGIIPARYASTRFPGKPLADINGKSMIVRVCEQVTNSGLLDNVLVATDDERILQHVRAAGFQALMTSPDHQSGTERCLEALATWESMNPAPVDAIINIQGDEPFIHPGQIREIITLLDTGKAAIATLAKQIRSMEELNDPNVVKIVFSEKMEALYFSRLPIPYMRVISEQIKPFHYKHIGIYGFQSKTLKDICKLPSGKLETAESLEQLRWLEHGYRIKVGITQTESIAIDSPEDLLKITNSA